MGRGGARPNSGPKRQPLESLFMNRVPVGDPDDCWEWQGGRGVGGYGLFNVNRTDHRKCYVAHRFSYEMHVGPIPDGMQIDHLCTNPPCVNPAHLEPVEPIENLRRGRSLTHLSDRTHCKNGHDLREPGSWYSPPSYRGRMCRECANDRRRAARRRKAG